MTVRRGGQPTPPKNKGWGKRVVKAIAPSKKARGSKISRIMYMQRLCRRFNVPFEGAKVYRDIKELDMAEYADAQRIIVRTDHSRSEFAYQPFGRIGGEIKRFLKEVGATRFVVQKTGLRQKVSHFGGIALVRNRRGRGVNIYFGEEPYYAQGLGVYKSAKDVFLPKIGAAIALNVSQVSENTRSRIKNLSGVEGLPDLINYLVRLKPWQVKPTTRLRFVKYYGDNTPYFFDLTYT